MTDEEKKALEEEEAKKKNPHLNEAEIVAKLKEENEKLKKDNESLNEAKKAYYDKVLNGGEAKKSDVKFRTSDEIKKEIIEVASKSSNLRNVQLRIEFDEAIKRETGESSFLPHGKEPDQRTGKYIDIVPTADERDLAERTSSVLKECLEEAGTDMKTFTGGDPVKFNAALMARKL